MDYNGKSHPAMVEIVGGEDGWWSEYISQQCDAIIYDDLAMVHVNSEMLFPPKPKYQSIPKTCIKELRS